MIICVIHLCDTQTFCLSYIAYIYSSRPFFTNAVNVAPPQPGWGSKLRHDTGGSHRGDFSETEHLTCGLKSDCIIFRYIKLYVGTN